MSYLIKQDTNYSGDISTLFQGPCQTKLFTSVLRSLYRSDRDPYKDLSTLVNG